MDNPQSPLYLNDIIYNYLKQSLTRLLSSMLESLIELSCFDRVMGRWFRINSKAKSVQLWYKCQLELSLAKIEWRHLCCISLTLTNYHPSLINTNLDPRHTVSGFSLRGEWFWYWRKIYKYILRNIWVNIFLHGLLSDHSYELISHFGQH